MNILWVSNYLSHSAYSSQSRMLVPALRAMGHQVTVLPIGAPFIPTISQAPDGTPLVPLGYDNMGNDIVEYHYRNLGCDIVISFTDIWALDLTVYSRMNWFPITPIDCALTERMKQALQAAKMPIAIASYGQEQMKKEGVHAPLLPMAITDAWQPGSMEEARAMLQWPDEFIASFVGMNDSLPSRKGIDILLQAWAKFLTGQTHSGAILYMHTHQTGYPTPGGGVNIIEMAEGLGIAAENLRIIEPCQYMVGLAEEDMVNIARASDVLVIPSRREGACIPVIEFQAVGTPVIVSDGHAQGDNVLWHFDNVICDYEKVWGVGGNWEPVVKIDNIVESLNNLYGLHQHVEKRATMSGQAHAKHNIATVIKNHLIPIMEAIANRMLSGIQEPKEQDNG